MINESDARSYLLWTRTVLRARAERVGHLVDRNPLALVAVLASALQAYAAYRVYAPLPAGEWPRLRDSVIFEYIGWRLARGERFAFERYLSRVRGCGPDGLLFEDTTHLAPGGGASDPSAPGVLGEFDVYGTLFVVAPDHETGALSDDLHAAVSSTDARAGATALPNDAGVAVRALGHRAEHVTESLRAAWDAARRKLLDAPAPAGRK